MNKIAVVTALILFLVLGIRVSVLISQSNHQDGDNHAFQHEVSIDSERDFLEHMILHHLEAIEVSRALLQNESPLRPLNELARSIVDSQAKEVENMNLWFYEWYGSSYQNSGEYANMMRSFEGLTMSERDRTFLEDMIVHHEAAITTAKQVLELSVHVEVEQLANNIIMTQEIEIGLMKELLTLLPQ